MVHRQMSEPDQPLSREEQIVQIIRDTVKIEWQRLPGGGYHGFRESTIVEAVRKIEALK